MFIKFKNNAGLLRLLPLFVLLSVALIFFYKTVLFGKIPFPGDLLLSEYNPWRQASYFGYNPGSIPSKGQYFDTIREFFPWLTFTIEELRKGSIPLWNPHNFSGQPHMANFLTAVFYPLNIIYFFTDLIDGYTIMIFLQPVLISVFMYLYAKKIGVSTVGSMFSAVILSYSSYMTEWMEYGVVGHALAWFPLTLYSIESLREKKKRRYVILFALSITMSLLAGWPIDFIYYVGFITLYWIYVTKIDTHSLQDFIRLSVKRAALTSISLLIGGIQLLPALTYYLSSARSAIPYDYYIHKMLIQPHQLITMLIPDYYGNPVTKNYWLSSSYVNLTLSIGIAPLVLLSNYLVVSIKNGLRNIYREKLFLFVLMAIYVVIINSPLTQLLFRIDIPFLSSSSPTRLLTLSMFLLSILSGRALDEYRRNNVNSRAPILIVVIFFFSFLSIRLFIPESKQVVAYRNTLYSSFFLIISCGIYYLRGKTYKWKLTAATLFILLTIAERFVAFQKFNPFVPRQYVYPHNDLTFYLQSQKGIGRIYGYGTAKIESNLTTLFKLYSADGFGAINYRDYNGFIRSSEKGRILDSFTQETRSVAEIFPGYGPEDLPSNFFRLRMMDALGVAYILDRRENPKSDRTFQADRFSKIWENDDGWIVYENKFSAPRFFLTENILYYSSKDDFEKLFFDENVDIRNTILIHSDDKPFVQTLPSGKKFVTLQRYEPNRIEFQSTSETPQMLYLSDTYDNGWIGYVDGKQTNILKANYSFRAMAVPQGNHTIIMLYRPKSLTIGYILTITGFIALLFEVIFHKMSYVEKKR